MTAIARGKTSSVFIPVLYTFIISDGVLTDVVSLEYVIATAPVDGSAAEQVYPENGRAAVDLVDDKLGTGRYVANWTVPADAAIGPYQITWYFTVADGDAEQTFSEPFEVLSAVSLPGPLYASVWSMRAEGFTASAVPDYMMHAKLVQASQVFERYTSRFFRPQYKELTVDSRGGPALLLQEPIIGIENVELTLDDFSTTGNLLTLDDVRVYNRHLTQGLLDPDDRENPKIEFISSEYPRYSPYRYSWRLWPKGSQNVIVRGVFGYTEPNGTPTGGVPHLVSRAVQLLAMKELPRLADTDAREDAQKRWAIVGERTRDQSYNLFSGVDAGARAALIGSITGDPAVDRIIVMFRRAMRVAGA